MNTNRFKSEINNWITQGLFFESAIKTKEYILYTLKDEDYTQRDGRVLPSLKKLFLESIIKDPSEYSFSVDYLGGWQHWKALQKSEWFAPYYAEWQEEKEVRILSNALKNLHVKASNPNDKESFQANKFILANGYGQQKDKVGRPSKQKIRAEAAKLLEAHRTVDDDLMRIRIGTTDEASETKTVN